MERNNFFCENFERNNYMNFVKFIGCEKVDGYSLCQKMLELENSQNRTI